jgi:hypothetical protein
VRERQNTKAVWEGWAEGGWAGWVTVGWAGVTTGDVAEWEAAVTEDREAAIMGAEKLVVDSNTSIEGRALRSSGRCQDDDAREL